MAQDPQELIFSLDKRYRLLNNGTKITMDLIVGPMGQSPDIDVRLNTKKLLEGFNQSIKDLLIDVDSKLDGKVLRITGNILDVAKDSNKIEVTLKIKGGVTEFNKKFTVTVEEDGEHVDIAFTIRFKI